MPAKAKKSTPAKKAPAKKATAKKATAKKAPAKKATAKKAPAKKAPAKKAPAKTTRKFPKKELNAFLRKNTEWDHNMWTGLLSELEEIGFGFLTETEEGRDAIGLYLETNRK